MVTTLIEMQDSQKERDGPGGYNFGCLDANLFNHSENAWKRAKCWYSMVPKDWRLPLDKISGRRTMGIPTGCIPYGASPIAS